MKPWSAFHPLVIADVTGCPVPMLDQALRNAAREFCKRTKAWAEWADAFTASGTTNRFDFDVGGGAELVAARRASVDGTWLNILDSDSLPGDWQQRDDTGPDGSLVHIDSTEYLIYPKPGAGAVIAIEMALRPSAAATGVGDVILESYAEAVAWGAKYRLQSQPGKAWTEPASAKQALMEFERAINAAANNGFSQKAPSLHRVKKWG